MKQSLRVALLLLCLSLFALPVFAQTSGEMDFGDTFESNLTTEDTSREYTFMGEEGQVVTITLVSDDFDPILALRDADGAELTMDDDSGPGSLNSRIGPYTLPETGEYTIVAQSYSNYYGNANPDAVGTFTLSLDEIVVRRIEYTQVAEAELGSTGAPAYFQFRGQAGDVINVTVQSDDFSPAISLSALSTSPSYSLSNASDYSGQGTAMIGGHVLQETGNYMIDVTSSDGTTGEFTVEVERLEVTPLAFDETVEIGFNENMALAYYSFEAESGDVINLVVEGDGSFDTTLSLNSPDGYQVAYADDSNGLDPALSNQILDASGTYTVIIQPYRLGEKGLVTLTLSRGILLSLDDGAQVLDFSSSQTRQTLVATGTAGEVVRLNVDVANEGIASPNISITQAGMSVAYVSGATIHRLSVDITIPSDGQILFQIEEYSYNNAQLEISLERLTETVAVPVMASPTPTPAVIATEEVVATEEDDGLIEPTEEAILDAPTAESTEAAAETPEVVATEEAAETPEAVETEAVEPEATEAA